MENLLQDLRYGFRMMQKSPAIALVAIVALALGIGANTAIFSVVNAVLLRPLPYKDSERLVTLQEKSQQQNTSVSYPNFKDWQEQNHVFEGMAAFKLQSFNLTGAGGPAERLQGRMVSASFFSTLGLTPSLGRDLAPDEDRPGGNPTAILSYGFWQRRFGGDQSVIGKQVSLDHASYTVVGVAPKDFEFYSPADVFVPIGAWTHKAMAERGSHPGINVIARLKQGVTLEQAHAELQTIMARLAAQYPETNADKGASVVQTYENIVGDVRPALLILLGAVGFVLLIACANVANLLLARSALRQKEIAIRAALGATRGRIVRQLLTESVLLALTGGGLGLLLALWGTDFLTSAIPDSIPRLHGISIDASVLGFTMAASLLTGLIFGLVPALQSSKLDLNDTLKEGGRNTTGGGQSLRSALVVSEVALALMLLVGAGLMVKSFVQLLKVDPGFNSQNILTMQLAVSGDKYKGPQLTNFFAELQQKIESLPEVQSAAVSFGLPIFGAGETSFVIDGEPPRQAENKATAVEYITSADYLQTMGIHLLKGRSFTPQDTQNTSPVVIIDENLGRKFFGEGDPIGKHLTLLRGSPSFEVIGVVGHVKHYGLDVQEPVSSQFYFAINQASDEFLSRILGGTTLVVRTTNNPLNEVDAVRQQVMAIDQDMPAFNVKTMEQQIAESMGARRFSMLLLTVFAALALALAVVGIYGVISYSVTQRTHEIGIRMALGARVGDVFKLVVGQGMTLVLVGVALGLLGAFALTRVMSSLLYGVSATDPLTFVVVSLLLAIVALVACLIPARRATKVDPMVALRYE